MKDSVNQPARYVSLGDIITIGTTYVGTGDEKTAACLNALLDRALSAEAEAYRWKEEALRLRVDIAAIELRSDVISMRGTTSRLASAEAREAKLREALESIYNIGLTLPSNADAEVQMCNVAREALAATSAPSVTGIPVAHTGITGPDVITVSKTYAWGKTKALGDVHPSVITDTDRLDWLDTNPKARAFGGDGCYRQVAIASERDEPSSDRAKPWYGRGPWSGRTIRAAIDAAILAERDKGAAR